MRYFRAAVPAATCSDIETPGYSCALQKGWGQCNQYWMQQNNYCAKTCGRCSAAPTAAGPTPRPTGTYYGLRIFARVAGHTCRLLRPMFLGAIIHICLSMHVLRVQHLHAGISRPRTTAAPSRRRGASARPAGCSRAATAPRHVATALLRLPLQVCCACSKVAHDRKQPCCWTNHAACHIFLCHLCASRCDVIAAGASCSDKDTPGYTCAQQKSFGACSASWMTQGGFCAWTCGRCSGGTAPPSAPAPSANAGQYQHTIEVLSMLLDRILTAFCC